MSVTMENPLIPMIAVTGTPSCDELRQTLEKWHSVGVVQFMIYARSGTGFDYLSSAWFSACKSMCKAAEELGYNAVWIYDEYNFPSGNCKYRVIQDHPEFRLQALCVVKSGGEYRFELRQSPVMSDLLNPQAVERFLSLTHQKYEQELGEYFGTLVKGFFTDEPDIGRFGQSVAGTECHVTWYDTLEEEYQEQTGGNLRQDMLRGIATGSRNRMERNAIASSGF